MSMQNPDWLKDLQSDYSDVFSQYRPDNLDVWTAGQIAALLCARLATQNKNRGFENVAVSPDVSGQLLGRVLACDVRAGIDVPGFDNAAMDGWALPAAATLGWAENASGGAAETVALREVATVLAGHSGALPTVGAGQCVRITTGAPLPVGCDCVVAWEMVRVQTVENSSKNKEIAPIIHIPRAAIESWANCRLRGQDIRAGAVAMAAGTRVGAAHVGLAASLGLASLPLVPRLRVAYFSTGDELRAPGDGLGAATGRIFDSNRATIGAMLAKIGCEIIHLPTVADEPDAIDGAIAQALAAGADAIVTTGGASLGAADYTRAQLQRRAQALAWQLALRPGRPFTLGLAQGSEVGLTAGVTNRTVDGEEGGTCPTSPQNGLWNCRPQKAFVPIFGLPGNPLAALVTFTLIARPALGRLAGVAAEQAALPCMAAQLARPVVKKAGRTQALFARFEAARWGQAARVEPLAQQSSGALSSAAAADALIVLPADGAQFAAGQWVAVWPMDAIV